MTSAGSGPATAPPPAEPRPEVDPHRARLGREGGRHRRARGRRERERSANPSVGRTAGGADELGRRHRMVGTKETDVHGPASGIRARRSPADVPEGVLRRLSASIPEAENLEPADDWPGLRRPHPGPDQVGPLRAGRPARVSHQETLPVGQGRPFELQRPPRRAGRDQGDIRALARDLDDRDEPVRGGSALGRRARPMDGGGHLGRVDLADHPILDEDGRHTLEEGAAKSTGLRLIDHPFEIRREGPGARLREKWRLVETGFDLPLPVGRIGRRPGPRDADPGRFVRASRAPETRMAIAGALDGAGLRIGNPPVLSPTLDRRQKARVRREVEKVGQHGPFGFFAGKAGNFVGRFLHQPLEGGDVPPLGGPSCPIAEAVGVVGRASGGAHRDPRQEHRPPSAGCPLRVRRAPSKTVGARTRVMHPDDRERVRHVARVSFGLDPRVVDKWIDRGGIDAWRVAVEDGHVTGMALRIPMGMWFHGRSVSNLGIAGVAMDPVYRGRGATATLMRDILREARDAGVALSTLYPSTRELYRAVGYELAGDHFEVAVRLDALPARSAGGDIAPWTADDRPAVRALQRGFARMQHGWLDRGAYIWARVEAPLMKPAEGYVIRHEGRIEGYVFLQVPQEGGFYDVSVSDWCVSTPRAADELTAFFARFRSFGDHVRYGGAPADVLTARLPARRCNVRLKEPFMLRIVDPLRAFIDRGYDPSVTAGLSIAVTADESLPENVACYRITVRDGQAEVVKRPGRSADVQCDIRGLAALYAGYLSARQLAVLGWVRGNDTGLRTAESVFGTRRPCLPEMF